VGIYNADLLVEDRVIVELKTAEQIHPEHLAQLSNYLKATQIEVGLLLNFGRRTSFKRVILTNDCKSSLGQSKANG
jgi:GxxExxY protein